MSIPTIDLVDCQTPDSLADAISQAASSIGFLYLRNTGLEEQASELFTISRSFFVDQSMEEKEACSMTVKNQGYSRPGQERSV